MSHNRDDYKPIEPSATFRNTCRSVKRAYRRSEAGDSTSHLWYIDVFAAELNRHASRYSLRLVRVQCKRLQSAGKRTRDRQPRCIYWLSHDSRYPSHASNDRTRRYQFHWSFRKAYKIDWMYNWYWKVSCSIFRRLACSLLDGLGGTSLWHSPTWEDICSLCKRPWPTLWAEQRAVRVCDACCDSRRAPQGKRFRTYWEWDEG